SSESPFVTNGKLFPVVTFRNTDALPQRLNSVPHKEPMETEPYSEDAAAVLAALRKNELYEVTQTEFDLYCDLQAIAGDRRWALEDERATYLLPPDDEIRMHYLADPATDIHWGWLLALRNKLEWCTTRRPRAD